MPLSVVAARNNWPNLPSRYYMMDGELGFLLTMLDDIKPKRMIELGVNEGITARAVLDHIKSIEYYLGVDVPFNHVMPLPGQQPEVPQEPGRLVKDDRRFELLLRYNGAFDSLIVACDRFDVAFIDGDHSYKGVMDDYELARKVVLQPGGWIFFHDYNNPTVEVTRALDDLHLGGRNIVNAEGTWMAYEQV